MSGAGISGELRDVLDRETIAALAGTRSFARGVVYAEQGAVGGLELAGGRIEATVQGTRAYRVRMGVADGRVVFTCSCPVGGEGEFCKHCVAVALCWLEDGVPHGLDIEGLSEYLHSLEVARLVELLLDHAREDEQLARRLDALRLRARDGPVDVLAYRSMIDRAITIHGYVDYREAGSFFAAVGEALDALESLLEDGHTAEVIGLSEHAIVALEAASGMVDDSDGGTQEACERAEQLHLRACLRARPDPVDLAGRLFAFTLEGELELFSDALERYVDVLGRAGVERYRELVEAQWAKLPALGRGERQAGRRWRVTSMMEALARIDGDVDRLVEVKAKDLADDWSYLQIVEILTEAGRDAEALRWAERGLASSTEHRDRRLREFVAHAYRLGGRKAEAVMLCWEQFRDTPTLETYRALREESEPLGEWPARREQALAELRATATEQSASGRSARRSVTAWMHRDRSTLVEIFLWERDVTAAWEEAQAGGCTPALWRELALARGARRPEDALAVYRMLVGHIVGQTNNAAYEHAVELLGELEQLLAGHGRIAQHTKLVAEVRETFRRKRNFVKLLDGRWPAAVGLTSTGKHGG